MGKKPSLWLQLSVGPSSLRHKDPGVSMGQGGTLGKNDAEEPS